MWGRPVGADEVRLGLVQAWAQAQVPGLKIARVRVRVRVRISASEPASAPRPPSAMQARAPRHPPPARPPSAAQPRPAVAGPATIQRFPQTHSSSPAGDQPARRRTWSTWASPSR
eukprot:scaffold23911_cov70-Phaeocystis_antarctica.AAC.1